MDIRGERGTHSFAAARAFFADFYSRGQIAAAERHRRPLADARETSAAAPHFIGHLESLRGIAALSVALFHSFHLLPVDGIRVYDRTLWNVPFPRGFLMRVIMVPFNGGAAVSLFFVLSGFVLALSLQRDNRRPPLKACAFIARRLFRIYPALAVNIALFALVIAVIATRIPMAPPAFRFDDVIGNLLLANPAVNGVTWTVRIEIIAIPLLLLGHAVSRHWRVPGLVLLVFLSTLLLFSPRFAFRTLLGEYAFMFFLGMLVAEISSTRSWELSERASRIGLVASIVIMMTARFILGYASHWSLFFEGYAGAALVAILVLGRKSMVREVLLTRPLRFLGRISYSFYLYHPLVLAVVLPALTAMALPSVLDEWPFVGSLMLAVVTVTMTIPLAYMSYLLVERPMIRLGRCI